MRHNCAAQRLDLAVEAGGVLEWWPDPVIPFRGARFWQETALTVDPDGTLLYGDLLLPGRSAAGERHDYAYYRSRLTAYRPDGTLLFTDVQALAPPPPGAAPLRDTLPAGLQTLGTVYLLARSSVVGPLLVALRDTLAQPPLADAAGGTAALAAGDGAQPPRGRPGAPTAAPAAGQGDAAGPGVLAGCSLLPRQCGVVVRMLAADGASGRRAMAGVLACARRHLLGADPPPPRKL